MFKRVPPHGIPCSTYGAKSREPRRWSPGHSSYSWHSVPSRGPHRWSPGSPQIGTLSCCCGRQVRFMVTRGWQERPKLSANMALGLIFKVPKAGTPRSRRCTQPAPPPPKLGSRPRLGYRALGLACYPHIPDMVWRAQGIGRPQLAYGLNPNCGPPSP